MDHTSRSQSAIDLSPQSRALETIRMLAQHEVEHCKLGLNTRAHELFEGWRVHANKIQGARPKAETSRWHYNALQ